MMPGRLCALHYTILIYLCKYIRSMHVGGTAYKDANMLLNLEAYQSTSLASRPLLLGTAGIGDGAFSRAST